MKYPNACKACRGLSKKLAASLLAVALLPSVASAQDVRRPNVQRVAAVASEAPPLTVNRRSWLDMGTAARVGTQDGYLAASTTLHEPVWASYLPDRFGRSTLPRQFSLPYNDNPRGPDSGGVFFDF